MSQYQSFPDAAGASRTLDKLKALKLPVLEGRSFLDIGCNEGFFCGFAKFLGAGRVVGLDKSKLFIERARARFPDCEFLQQDWDTLPEGPFDVILLASALHYAQDQPALIRRLVDRLSPDGTLVLEMGIASAPGSEWIEVDRGIDRRSFPTMAKLREVLVDYAWKWTGRSVSQAGDPVSRHVVHVSRRRPVAYLLMQPPGYGKSSIASGLFPRAGLQVVSGDQRLADAAQGSIAAQPALKAILDEAYSPFRIDALVRTVFDRGAGDGLVQLWIDGLQAGDFALDVYVPEERQAEVESMLSARGYLPVRLQWERVGPPLLSGEAVAERAEAFYASLPVPEGGAAGDVAPMEARGYVDEVRFDGERLVIRGWAADVEGELPPKLLVRAGGREVEVAELGRHARADVQRHLRLPHARVGFLATVQVEGIRTVDDLREGFEVHVPGSGRIRLNVRVTDALAGRGGAGRQGGAG